MTFDGVQLKKRNLGQGMNIFCNTASLPFFINKPWRTVESKDNLTVLTPPSRDLLSERKKKKVFLWKRYTVRGLFCGLHLSCSLSSGN